MALLQIRNELEKKIEIELGEFQPRMFQRILLTDKCVVLKQLYTSSLQKPTRL
jgi:hypothetical protein